MKADKLTDFQKYIFNSKDKNDFYSQKICDLIDKHNGNIALVAQDIQLNPATVMRYLKKYDLWEYTKMIRADFNEVLCDAAVSVLKSCLQKADVSPHLALKASMYILDRLGKERGFTQHLDISNRAAELIDHQDASIKIAYKNLEPNDNNDVPDANSGVQ